MRVEVTFWKTDVNGVRDGLCVTEQGCAYWKVEHGSLTLYSEELAPVGMQPLPKVTWAPNAWVHVQRINTPPEGA